MSSALSFTIPRYSLILAHRSNMPKRKASEINVDPSPFIDAFCERHMLANSLEFVPSDSEKACRAIAQTCRTEFKMYRDAELDRKRRQIQMDESGAAAAAHDDPGTNTTTGNDMQPDGSGMDYNPLNQPTTAAEKYRRRLFNNRKSAATSKVSEEIYERATGTLLHSLEFQLQKQRHLIKLSSEERAQLWRQVRNQREEISELHEQVAQLQAELRREKMVRLSSTQLRTELSGFNDLISFGNNAIRDPTSNDDPLMYGMGNSQGALSTSEFLDARESQGQVLLTPTAGRDSQNHEMIGTSSSLALSQVNDSEAHKYTTGMTCSQDNDMSGPRTDNLLGSQPPSQDMAGSLSDV